jgi:ribosome-binding protein aMBF1 (putative translation factor)
MNVAVYKRTFARAAEVLGGEDKLAEQLNVTLDDLKRWTSGAAEPPPKIFLHLAEILKLDTLSAFDGLRSHGAPVLFNGRKMRPVKK